MCPKIMAPELHMPEPLPHLPVQQTDHSKKPKASCNLPRANLPLSVLSWNARISSQRGNLQNCQPVTRKYYTHRIDTSKPRNTTVGQKVPQETYLYIYQQKKVKKQRECEKWINKCQIYLLVRHPLHVCAWFSSNRTSSLLLLVTHLCKQSGGKPEDSKTQAE